MSIESLPPAPFFPQSANITESVATTTQFGGGNQSNFQPSQIPSIIHTNSETTVDYWAETLPPWATHSANNSESRPTGPLVSNGSTGELPFEGPFVTGIPGVGAG